MGIATIVRACFGKVARSAVPAGIETELTAIRTYARFIAVNPDMPASHREWFLTQILRSCEEIGGTVAWRPLGHAVERNQSV